MEWGGALLGYAAMPRRLVISMHFYKAAAYSISYAIIQIIRDERIKQSRPKTSNMDCQLLRQKLVKKPQ